MLNKFHTRIDVELILALHKKNASYKIVFQAEITEARAAVMDLDSLVMR